MYINLPKLNFDIFNNIRVFLLYRYPDIIEKDIQINEQSNKITNKLNSMNVNKTILDLFDLKQYVNQLAMKFNVPNNHLYKTNTPELYYYYCECLQHAIFKNSFMQNTYSVLKITNKSIPLINILNKLYPMSTFIEESNIGVECFKDVCSINNFIQCSSNYVNSFNFIVIDLEYEVNPMYSVEETILMYFCYVLNILASNGSCIINFYFYKNMTHKVLTIELLTLLSNCFQYVSILNPQCSSSYQPHFYLLCRNLQKSFYKSKYMNISLSLYQNILYKPIDKEVYSILQLTIPLFYKNKLNDLINQFLYDYVETLQQIYNFHIHYDKNKIDLQCKKRILKAKQWIHNFSVVHHQTCNSLQVQEINQILCDIINVIELCNEE